MAQLYRQPIFDDELLQSTASIWSVPAVRKLL